EDGRYEAGRGPRGAQRAQPRGRRTALFRRASGHQRLARPPTHQRRHHLDVRCRRLPDQLITQKGATTLDSHSWTRDAVGNPLMETNNGFNATFGFDDLYRITSATDPTGTYSWGYDADNNRLSQLLNGTNTTYTVDTANHLTSVGGVMVITDANGNLQDD